MGVSSFSNSKFDLICRKYKTSSRYDYEEFEREVPVYVVKKVKAKRNKVIKSKKKIKRKRQIKKKVVKERENVITDGPDGGSSSFRREEAAAFSGYVLVPRSFGVPAIQWQYQTEVCEFCSIEPRIEANIGQSDGKSNQH